jgi:hypothetical protein
MSSISAQVANEREQLIALLEKSEKCWLEVLGSVPESAAGAKLNDQCWSILEVAEHVAAAEHGMFRAMELATDKNSAPNYDADQKIIAGGTNRTIKRQAPAPSLPKGRWQTLAECAAVFQKSRSRTLEMVRNTDNLRGKSVMHPILGELDGHQLVLVMAGHCERHALQVEEIKASQSYKGKLSNIGSE